MMIAFRILYGLTLFVAGRAIAADVSTNIDGRVVDFELRDVRGARYSLSDCVDTPVVVLTFLGTECPLAKLYAARLVELANRYKPQGVIFFGISSNTQDSVSELVAFAQRHQIAFPLLKDLRQELADRLGAQRTPEVFVLDRQRQIRYCGRIDDQYGVGYARQQPERSDLCAALDELLAGRAVTVPVTEAVGCFIGRKPQRQADGGPVNYAEHIAPLLNKHCVECHRDGEIAPFSLVDYDEVSAWAETMAGVVRDGRMPPWNANPEIGHFRNARTMTSAERQLIYDWAAAGAPAGNLDRAPSQPKFVRSWRLPREPDLVLAMRDEPFEVPASGTVEYQYFVVDPAFKTDQWVAASEVVPGNRAVVHHAIVFVRPPEPATQKGLGWLGAYVPGQQPMVQAPGRARLVPAGSKLIFQLHYTPNGSVQTDITRVGLSFTEPETVREQSVTLVAIHRHFEIPPHAEDYLVKFDIDHFPSAGKLIAVSPHMHIRGKSFRMVADDPEQSNGILVDVPRYDFNWQHIYEFAQPLPVSKALRIECHARFDNSVANLANPDPSATVRWGDQTWEEMAIAFFEIAVPRGHEYLQPQRRTDEPTEEELSQANRKARELFQRFDTDRNSQLVRDELPKTFAVFAFRDFDQNGDGLLTRDECQRMALQRLRDKRLPF